MKRSVRGHGLYFTYILKSLKTSGAIYIGYTNDLKSRLASHNSSQNSGYTKRHAPWEIESFIAFSNKENALRFEEYLKSSSGKAFMKKRLISYQFKKNLEDFRNNRK